MPPTSTHLYGKAKMTLTLLLDLDDTLLENNIDTFLPAYLSALGKHMGRYVAPEKMVKDLLTATQVMLTNNGASLSLERAFDGAFYPAIGQTKEALREPLEQFYDEVFPNLRDLTAQRPEAVQLVEEALKEGHTVVVATNPLFPRKAILHRLRWAGLDPDRVSFAMITTYEHFHFAKPNPAYFAEILAQLGWPNQPAVVVGNSLRDDLLPAAKLGLPVYWVSDPPTPLPNGFNPLSVSGGVAGVRAWIKQVDASGLRQEFTMPEAMLAVLKSTPAAFDTICSTLTPRQWLERPQPEEWSLTEIFCHLRDVDIEINLPRVEKVMQEKNPFLAGVNSDSWTEERNYPNQDGQAALADFIVARSRLIERLERLQEEDWKLPARHAIFGPTNLRELVSFIATHDRSHVQQVHSAIRALA
jgi:FMN phosphatase YigB (HAD superfamily)